MGHPQERDDWWDKEPDPKSEIVRTWGAGVLRPYSGRLTRLGKGFSVIHWEIGEIWACMGVGGPLTLKGSSGSLHGRSYSHGHDGVERSPDLRAHFDPGADVCGRARGTRELPPTP